MSHSIEFLREKLARVRRGHIWPKGTHIESVEYGEVQKEGFTQIYVNGALGCVVTRREGNDEDIVWHDSVWVEKWQRGVFVGLGAQVWIEPDVWKRMWTRDNEWYRHATEFYVEEEPAEPVWSGVGFQLEKARRGMDFIEQGMREELQEIIDYDLKEKCDALKTLKASLQLRLNSVDVYKSTAVGIQTWKDAVQADLQTFTDAVGLPEYSGGEGGTMPRLVDTALNRMKDFVNTKINACVHSAEGLRIKRLNEDAWTQKPTTTPRADMRRLLCRLQRLNGS